MTETQLAREGHWRQIAAVSDGCVAAVILQRTDLAP